MVFLLEYEKGRVGIRNYQERLTQKKPKIKLITKKTTQLPPIPASPIRIAFLALFVLSPFMILIIKRIMPYRKISSDANIASKKRIVMRKPISCPI